MASVSHRTATPYVAQAYDEASLQTIVDRLNETQEPAIVQLPQALSLTSQVVIEDTEDVHIVGNGTVISGSVSGPAFKFMGTNNCSLGGFRYDTLSGSTNLVYLSDFGSGQTRSSRFMLHDVFVLCNGVMQSPIYVAHTPDGAKNDNHRFVNVTAQDYTFAFARLEGQASVANGFWQCLGQGRDHGQYCIYAKYDTQVGKGGQFAWYGGVMMEHAIADIRGDWRNGKNIASGVTSEQSARALMVDSAGGSFSGNTITLEGWEYVNNSSVLPADNEIIQVYAGALNVRGCTFGQATTGDAVTGLDYKFRYDITANKRLGFVFDGNTVWSKLSSGWFSSLAPDSKAGSYNRSGTSPTVAM